MSVIVPLQPIPNQTVTVLLGGQNSQINVYQKMFGLFLDLLVDNQPIITGTICQFGKVLVIDVYLGFIGDLCWIDTQAQSDPVYTGLGSRWQLVYLTPADMAALGQPPYQAAPVEATLPRQGS